MKKYVVPVIVIVVVMLVVFMGIYIMNNSPELSNESNNTGLRVITEKERYATLEAEFACQLLGVEEGLDVMDVMADFPELAEKHNFTLKKIDELQKEYREDEEFIQMAFEEMKEQCPELLEEKGLNNFSMKSPGMPNLD